MNKFNAKWRCKGCGCYFEIKQSHGCLDKQKWIKLIMKVKCDFCGKKKECKILKAKGNYKVHICKDCFLKVRSED